MPCRSVTDEELTLNRSFSTSSGLINNQEGSGFNGVTRETEWDGLGTQGMLANTELSHSAFYVAESKVRLFDLSEVMSFTE